MPWAGRGGWGGWARLQGRGGWGGSPHLPRRGGLLAATRGRAACTSAEGEGYGLHPCAFSTGRRDVLHPCVCQQRVEGLGLHPRARQHKVEGTVGVAPLQPTPAPLPIEGLWECCNSCTRAAAHVLLLAHPVYGCSFGSAAALQPTPAPSPARGYGGAATTALKLQRTHGSSCSPCLAAVLALHPHRSQARSSTNRGATGVLQEPHSGGCPRTAAPQPESRRTSGAAAAPQPSPALLPTEGLRGGRGRGE